MSWTVILAGSARRDLRRLDPPVVSRILDALDRLATTGQGDTPRLRGTPSAWRLRVGDWRVRFQYNAATRTLEVLRILPRGEAYR